MLIWKCRGWPEIPAAAMPPSLPSSPPHPHPNCIHYSFKVILIKSSCGLQPMARGLSL